MPAVRNVRSPSVALLMRPRCCGSVSREEVWRMYSENWELATRVVKKRARMEIPGDGVEELRV